MPTCLRRVEQAPPACSGRSRSPGLSQWSSIPTVHRCGASYHSSSALHAHLLATPLRSPTTLAAACSSTCTRRATSRFARSRFSSRPLSRCDTYTPDLVRPSSGARQTRHSHCHPAVALVQHPPTRAVLPSPRSANAALLVASLRDSARGPRRVLKPAVDCHPAAVPSPCAAVCRHGAPRRLHARS